MLISRWFLLLFVVRFSNIVCFQEITEFRDIPSTSPAKESAEWNNWQRIEQTNNSAQEIKHKMRQPKKRNREIHRTKMNMTKNTNLIHNFNFSLFALPKSEKLKSNDKLNSNNSHLSFPRPKWKVSKATQSQMFTLAYIIFALFLHFFFCIFPRRSYRLINFHTFISILRGAVNKNFILKCQKLFFALFLSQTLSLSVTLIRHFKHYT